MNKTSQNATEQFKECEALFQKKLADYGTTGITITEQVLARMKEKIIRVENLLKVHNQTEDETIEDTFLDLAGYAIIGRLIEKGMWGTDKECQDKEEMLTINGQNLQEPKFESDVGYDLKITEDMVIPPLPSLPVIVPSEVRIAMPKGYYCQIVGRSSAANKLGLLVHTAIIDGGYRNRFFACCWNLSGKPVTVKKGERIAQVIFQRIHLLKKKEVKELPDSKRGLKGFGSTGK